MQSFPNEHVLKYANGQLSSSLISALTLVANGSIVDVCFKRQLVILNAAYSKGSQWLPNEWIWSFVEDERTTRNAKGKKWETRIKVDWAL